MAKRIFLDCRKPLPRLIAERLLAGSDAGLPDLSGTILVLPGRLARQQVLRELEELAPDGLLLPTLLTPALLLRGETARPDLPGPTAAELLWNRAVARAARTPERFDLLFPEGVPPDSGTLSGRKFMACRDEAVRGGRSLAELIPVMDARGEQLAALERIFLEEAAACGCADPLAADRQAAADPSPLTDPTRRLVLAGVPDLPNLLRAKLENLDRAFPDRVEVWIHAPETQAAEFDALGVPDPEVWGDKALELPPDGCLAALDAENAAKLAAQLAAGPEGFDPAECAIVLSDPELMPAFQREFARFAAADGTPLEFSDPAGVPLGRLRLCRLGLRLLALLEAPDECDAAWELLREPDYLRHLETPEHDAARLLTALDAFLLRFVPDRLDRAAELAATLEPESGGQLAAALDELRRWPERFAALSVPEFLREFCRTVYPQGPELDRETVNRVPFARECAAFRTELAELDRLPEPLAAPEAKLQTLKIFLDRCSQVKVPAETGPCSCGPEGCLEIPFLTAPRVIFCGFNDRSFPDRIDATPFFTDSIRRRAGLRSNRETVARARCHLQSLLACRAPGAVRFIVLRRDRNNQVLRPSPLLFAGRDLPEAELLRRCAEFFRDPAPFPEELPPPGGKLFRLRPALDFNRAPDGAMTLSPTDLDQYLKSPFGFFFHRVRRADAPDYSADGPDAAGEGTLLHAVFEASGRRSFPDAGTRAEAMLAALDAKLTAVFGPPPYPTIIRLRRENLRQRLRAAAAVLQEEAAAGFVPVELEYQLRRIPLGGAVFSGKIDRIEYHPERKIVRIIDLKTGKPSSVADAHRKRNRDGSITFFKLQLPLYGMLLREDPEFRRAHPDIALDRLECGYLNLPENVTETRFSFWPNDDFEAILPEARVCAERIIREIGRMPEGVLFEEPDAFDFSFERQLKELFPDGLRAGLTHVCWHAGEPPEADPTPPEADPTPPEAEAEYRPVPAVSPAEATDSDPVWNCPAEARERSGCPGPAACPAFHGFRQYDFIAASAGTGKTYRLATRFVQLLAFGVDPASVLAVTFTRKAAGEIFDDIIGRMLKFAASADRICPCVTRETVLNALRKLLDPNQEFQISTIDSFFLRLVQAFAPELGVWGDVELADPDDDRILRRTARRWVRSFTDPEPLACLRELLKRVDRDGGGGLAAALTELLKRLYPFYLEQTSRAGADPEAPLNAAIWTPDAGDLLAPAALTAVGNDLAAEAEDVDILLERYTAERTRKSLAKLAESLRRLADSLRRPPEKFGLPGPEVNDIFERIAKANSETWYAAGNDAELRLSRSPRIVCRAAGAAALRRAFRHIRAALFHQERERTRQVFAMLARFDALYAPLRRAGRLNFAELPFLLSRTDPDTHERVLGTLDRALEQRLDAAVNHYLFDEFQDTNDYQWQVFDGLVRELFSGDNGEFRTFFCVGDIKQSIYGWRGGNPRLFSGLVRQAAQLTDYDPVESLNLSRRSAQSVLDLVNCVFLDEYAGPIPGFEAARRQLRFAPHVSWDPDREGFAAAIECGAAAEARAAAIFALLRRIRPLERGLSVAILVRKNRTVEDYAVRLRQLARKARWDLPISSEGRVMVGAGMAFNCFAALLTVAEHPGDPLAREVLAAMTFSDESADPEPLGWRNIAARLRLPPETDPAVAVREELFRSGIAGLALRFLAGFGAEMRPADRERMEHTVRMAENFSGTPDEFIARVRRTGVAAASLDGSIQIMTYHHSKGLGFDLVLLPDLDARTGGDSSVLPAARSDGGTPAGTRWISYMPRKVYASTIAEYAEYAAQKEADDDFEECCGLYVALTRAKRGLYLFLPPPPKNPSSTLALDQVVRDRLKPYGVQIADRRPLAEFAAAVSEAGAMRPLFTRGRENWYEYIEAAPKEDVPPPRIDRRATVSVRRRRLASAEGEHSIAPDRRFAAPGGAAVGTLVHAALEKLRRIAPDFDVEKFLGETLPPEPPAEAAAAILRRALAPGSEIRTMLENVPAECDIWCERRFLLRLSPEELVPGAFDRVAVFRRDGVPVRAEIYDWKSDALSAEADFLVYSGQLRLYRTVLARMLRLPESAVSTAICALRLGQIIPVD